MGTSSRSFGSDFILGVDFEDAFALVGCGGSADHGGEDEKGLDFHSDDVFDCSIAIEVK